MFNTPSELYAGIRNIGFHLFFMSTTTVTCQKIFVEHLGYSTEYSNPMYHDLIK